jgi:hypothetical protein
MVVTSSFDALILRPPRLAKNGDIRLSPDRRRRERHPIAASGGVGCERHARRRACLTGDKFIRVIDLLDRLEGCH